MIRNLVLVLILAATGCAGTDIKPDEFVQDMGHVATIARELYLLQCDNHESDDACVSQREFIAHLITIYAKLNSAAGGEPQP